MISIENKTYTTNQEEFWVGKFGNDYIKRNCSDDLFRANLNFFNKSLNSVSNIKSCIEFGSNIGMNLKALKYLLPNVKYSAIEINENAYTELLKNVDLHEAYNESILNFSNESQYDLVLIKGVLIHINPEYLHTVYNKLYKTSKKYILIAEYYNPTPIEIIYRGHNEKLYKRDFAGEMLDKFESLELVDYGFTYRRDNKYKHGDLNWFLLEKK